MKIDFRLRRAAAVLIAAIMLLSVTACAKNTADQDETEDITLTLWTIATESDAYHEPYMKAIADYEAAHSGVNIVMETFENESYKIKLRAAVAANEMPDIFFTWSGGFSSAFVEAGRVLCVEEQYADYADELHRSMLCNLIWDDKVYGCGYTMNVSMLFYNKELFASCGLEAPSTYDELYHACEVLIENNITPFAISAKDSWVLAQMYDALLLKSAGQSGIDDLLCGKAPEALLDAAERFNALKSLGAFNDNAASVSSDEANELFYSEQAAMCIMGSWLPGTLYAAAEHPERFGVVPVPVVNELSADINDYMGGLSDSLMVSASTRYPDEAARAMFEIARGVSHYGYLSGSGMPAWKITYDDSEVKVLTKQIAEYVADADSFTLWLDTLMDAENASVYLDSLQLLYLGQSTPEKFYDTVSEQISGSTS